MGVHHFVPVEGNGEWLGGQAGSGSRGLWNFELTVGDLFHLSPAEDMAFWPDGCSGQLLGRAVWHRH